LLGYSYFEAYIADLVKEILISRPKLLPKDKTISFGSVIDAKNYDDLMIQIVEKHVFSIMYDGIEEIVKYFDKKLHIRWPNCCEEYSVVKASLIRNCYMRNGGIVDDRLSEKYNFIKGNNIELKPSDVHGYGLEIRRIAYDIYDEATARHINNHI